MESVDPASSVVTVFDVQRSELNVQVVLSTPHWALFHEIPRLYTAILLRLGSLGVNITNIRTDAGDGTLGGYNVSFWMLNARCLVRIRPTLAEISYSTFTNDDVANAQEVLVGVVAALRDSGGPDFAIANITVELASHGSPRGIEAPTFLRRFINRVPEGLGNLLGAGVVFYFESPDTLLKVITADLSAMYPGSLYVRFVSRFSGDVDVASLAGLVDRQITEGLHGLGLRGPSEV